MNALRLALLALLVLPHPARAESERAGDFDYYLLTLSWSPTWCALIGDARDDPQCERPFGFTLHGLWPQYETGFPTYCRTAEGDPNRAQTAGMADIMGGAGLAFYEWKKHGRCSGLSAADYFATARRAYDIVTIPPVLRGLARDVTLPASVVEDAFVESNPQLSPDMLTVTCDEGMIEEVRICLTRDLEPRVCGEDVIHDCRLKDAVMERVR
jgi:ribonuclease T2